MAKQNLYHFVSLLEKSRGNFQTQKWSLCNIISATRICRQTDLNKNYYIFNDKKMMDISRDMIFCANIVCSFCSCQLFTTDVLDLSERTQCSRIINNIFCFLNFLRKGIIKNILVRCFVIIFFFFFSMSSIDICGFIQDRFFLK